MKYYLLRHGAYTEGEGTLNEHGITQVEKVIRKLSSEDQVYSIKSSNGPRAQQTTRMIAQHFGTDFESVSWLDKQKDQQFSLSDKIQQIKAVENIPVLVASGEFIHMYIIALTQHLGIENPLKPLVKGEVMLCKINGGDMGVSYFN